MAISRSDAEDQLAAALSRHIGYTTGAYKLDRVAGIAELFHKKTSLYQYQVVRHLVESSKAENTPIGEHYAAEIINVAVALGIMRKVADGPTAGTRRFSLTPEGFTIKSALRRNHNALLTFTLMGLVLTSDCDGYGLLLDILHEEPTSGASLHKQFQNRFDALRADRRKWLARAIPNRILRARIHERMSSDLNHQRGQTHSTNFGRHHVTPRVGWGKWFGHIHEHWPFPIGAEESALTNQGIELVRTLRKGESRYTWLGPEDGTQEALGITKALHPAGPVVPSWNLLRPSTTNNTDGYREGMVQDVSEFMYAHYDDLRLVFANQASIASILPYLHLRECELGYAVETERVLDKIFELGSSFTYLSSRRHKYSYYQPVRPISR